MTLAVTDSFKRTDTVEVIDFAGDFAVRPSSAA
jgi:hypothetical protein